MQYHAFVIKYAEIAVKGKNRWSFEETLAKRIKEALSGCDGRFTVSRVTGRIYVEAQDFDLDETVSTLSRVFGINGICPAVCITRDSEGRLPYPEALAQAAIDYMQEVYPQCKDIRDTGNTHGLTFKVFVRRVDKTYPLTSMELAADIGEALLSACPGLTVDVNDPDISLHIELRERVNIFSQVIPGPGGMPIGTGGKAMLLLSGGIDSPVAGYSIARRGVSLEAVYFNAPPYTSERALQKVVDLATSLSRYCGRIRLHNINFTAIQLYIYEKCPHDELTIHMRRYMMRIAERLALDNNCQALITGESIGQVASQTMESLLCTNSAVRSLPVFRPLIAMDKQDIIDRSEAIGTYDTSILPYEDCCTIFVAKHPVTKPRLDIIERHEKLLDEKIDELVQEAIGKDEVICCS